MRIKKIASWLLAGTLALSLINPVSTTKKVQAAAIQKNIVAYMPNWAMYNAAHQSMNPDQIPWDKITVVNHAFFTVDTSFKIASLDQYADFQASFLHSGDWTVPANEKGFFGEYKYFKSIYPDKKVIVSIGGWTRGENFHAMALTAASRTTFINSVIDFLKTYPFIDGVDIDWEYPGINRAGDPNDSNDRGCPGGPEDKLNFTALLKEIRAAYNANGMTTKMLTIAAPAGYEKLALIEPDKFAQYLDFINVMTYDMHGAWETVTNHQSPLYADPEDPSPTTPIDVKNKYNASDCLTTLNVVYGVPKNKLNMGTPFYSRGWKGVLPGPKGNGLYQTSTGAYTGSLDSPSAPGGQEPWFTLKQFETTAGWVKYYDNTADAVWLYNQSKGVFLTYEDEKTLTDKCNYVNSNAYGGIILWEITGDSVSSGFPMTTLIYNNLKGSITNTLQPATLSSSTVTNGGFTLSAVVPAYNTATSYKFFEGTTQIASGTLTAGQSSSVTLTTQVTNKQPGSYNYTVQLTAGTSNVTSNQVTVTVPSAPTLQAAVLSAGAVTNGSYTLTAVVPANNTATSYKFFEGTTQIATGTLTAGSSTSVNLTSQITGKSAGTYSYTVVVYDASNSLTSNTVSVTVTNQGYPTWAAWVSYKVGDMVTYGGLNYKCWQAHTSLPGWEPPATPALWQLQ
jgi:chitinase